jgi:ATP-dependent DNA helicase RecG
VSARRSLPAFAGGRFAGRPQPPPRFFDADALERPLTDLAGVRGALARRLAGFGLEVVGDLLRHYPRRYEDFRERKRIADLRVGEEATIRATVEKVSSRRTQRRRVAVVTATVADGTGTMPAVWFNQGYLAKVLQSGMLLGLRGTYKRSSGSLSFLVRTHEILDDEGESVHTEGFVPVYPASEGISARTLRRLVHEVRGVARSLPDPLSGKLRADEDLPTHADAVLAMHFPRSPDEAARARDRLVLEELLLLQVGLLLHKEIEQGRAQAVPLSPGGSLSQRFVDGLPFALTSFQEEAIVEIGTDLRRDVPMRRLLQGDVGSGKTVVALHALLCAVEAGHQGAFMAPTETLAEQHLETIARLAGGLARVELLTARLTAAERRAALARIAAGEAQVVVGTHALLQEDVSFRSLAVVVVDEQHRFGVSQRDELARRNAGAGTAPHTLYMTATPIPRTLALTFYGDLDVTLIGGSPAGRRPVVTRLVPESKRALGYGLVRKQLDKGRQAYVVCPLIDESEALATAAALAEAERLRDGELHGYRLAVLHGQLKTAEREVAMAAFKAGEIDVLVATSVIEVGVDVPNATVMVVEGAERFGLAQLHQLRGRVGRGRYRSYCLLFADTAAGRSDDRLRAVLQTSDGFALADRDLEIRGEGQLFGPRQSGLPDLKLAKLIRDREAVVRARMLAGRILEDDPHLRKAAHAPLAEAVRGAFGDELAWLLKA